MTLTGVQGLSDVTHTVSGDQMTMRYICLRIHWRVIVQLHGACMSISLQIDD